MARLSVHKLKEFKKRGEKFAMLTAYDYPTAKVIDAAGIPVILVGDSLGNVVLGYESTIPVTMDDMVHHTAAVVRGTQRAIVVGDLPFMSYQADLKDAMYNSARLMKEAGATAVKLEGGQHMAETVRRLVEVGVPVMGHIGLTPQSVNQLGGHKVQGRTPAAAIKLLQDARALEEAGAFALVLETIPAPLARLISQKIAIPTIGIGAGPDCDGQVQVLHDMLGLDDNFYPKHARRYAHLSEVITGAVQAYAEDVARGAFPAEAESFPMDEGVLDELFQTA
jgi:3-methyl-2-oxobutanoate hydroxymethyltransferase